MTNSNLVTMPITRTADWEPIEVSLVPVAPEEADTGFRYLDEQGPPI
jgi:hypothetical protein